MATAAANPATATPGDNPASPATLDYYTLPGNQFSDPVPYTGPVSEGPIGFHAKQHDRGRTGRSRTCWAIERAGPASLQLRSDAVFLARLRATERPDRVFGLGQRIGRGCESAGHRSGRRFGRFAAIRDRHAAWRPRKLFAATRLPSCRRAGYWAWQHGPGSSAKSAGTFVSQRTSSNLTKGRILSRIRTWQAIRPCP